LVVEGLQRLIELQGLDDELYAAEGEHSKVPERRRELEERRSASEEKLAGASEALHTAEMEQRRVEGELREQEALLHKLEGQQFQVKSNEAYTALLHEMERARQAISECETRILESMEVIEVSSVSVSEGEVEVAAIREQAATEEKALDEREKVLEVEVARLRGERAALCARIESGVLAHYMRIASRRRPAVVCIAHEMCLGCRVNIPPQNYIEILKAERIITCGNCHRILIQEPKIEAPAAS
jgi:predicted  nucleic acid-binding Zn-ribbon protein